MSNLDSLLASSNHLHAKFSQELLQELSQEQNLSESAINLIESKIQQLISKPQEEIAIIWHIQDVQNEAENIYDQSISDADALKVLDYLKRTHNSEIGINWLTIRCAIETLIEDKYITLV